MIFKVEKLDVVNGEIAELQQEQQDLLKSEYELIETKGIEFVRVKHLQAESSTEVPKVTVTSLDGESEILGKSQGSGAGSICLQ